MIRVALCGDVMLGRGIDQILPYPADPMLYGRRHLFKNARGYIALAERRSGALPLDRGPAYVWGDALAEREWFASDVRLINLETAITAADKPWPDKRIVYRMHPRNVEVLISAQIDFCALANNHVLDLGYVGLSETVVRLRQAGIACAGAGGDRKEAAAPAILPMPGRGRLIVVSFTTLSGHTPLEWSAGEGKPGVNLVPTNDEGLAEVRDSVAGIKGPRDVLIASVHAGANYGHPVAPDERRFFLKLIDAGGFALVHCHSSHHVKAIEVHNGAPILYGTGDLINDYEGTPASPLRQSVRSDLGTLAFAEFSCDTGACTSLRLRPMHVRRLQARRASLDDAAELCAILGRESAGFGTRIVNEGGLIAVVVKQG